METLKILPHDPMNSVSTYLRCFSPAKFRTFCVSSIDLSNTDEVLQRETSTKRVLKKSLRVGVTVSNAKLKDDWLDSLTFPVLDKVEEPSIVHESKDGGLEWIVGVDPDASGALALLKTDESGCTAQVFDSPHVQVLVGKNIRKRLDAKSIVQLLQSFDAPQGTTAYIEQSTPFPKDGKQGWWGGGFGYGMWIGILVASGYSVVPVPSASWKKHFNLSGSLFTKDDSRTAAGTLFPSLSSLLRRKKDHGRAEALLIAAYGKGLKINTDSV